MQRESEELSWALEAVRTAALLVRRVQESLVTPALSKADRSPVTVGDFAAQAVVAASLAEQFPHVPLVGEEQAALLRASPSMAEQVADFVRQVYPAATADQVLAWIDRGGAEPGPRFWTLDPIDGTKGFLRREQYAVALALIDQGQVRLGVLGCPGLVDGCRQDAGGAGSLLFARAGQGAEVRPLATAGAGRPLRVSPCSDPRQARLLGSVESGHTNQALVDALCLRLGMTAAAVRLDSQAKYAVLAAGGGEILVRFPSEREPDYREKIWDHAAGALIVEEAGGRATDLAGQPFDFGRGRSLAANRGVLATNGGLHAAVVEAIAGLRGGQGP